MRAAPMEVLKKIEGGFDLAAAEHVLCWHINTALQIVNALRFKGNVAPFAVETQASAFSFLLFFLLFAEVQIFCIDCKTIFRLCQKPFECCPMCRRSVQTVAWDEHTPGLRVKPVEGVDAGVHACHEKAEKILGRIKKKNFWDQASHGASSFATVVGGGYHKIRSRKLGTCKQRLGPLSGMHVPGEC